MPIIYFSIFITGIRCRHLLGLCAHLFRDPIMDTSRNPTGRRSPLGTTATEFLRGALSSVTSIFVTFPLNKAVSRQAYEGLRVSEALLTLRLDGVLRLYRGLGPPLCQKAVSMSIMYGTYDYFYHTLSFFSSGVVDPRPATDIPLGESSWVIRASAAVLAGSVEGLLAPFERVQTILQHRHYTHAFTNSLDVVQKLRGLGMREYYRGLSAILLRNGPSNAFFFTLRTPIKQLVPPQPPNAGHAAAAAYEFGRDFFSGAVLGAAISTLFFPLNPIKAVMQLQIGGRHKGILEALREVLAERGVAGLYRGVGLNAARALLGWGIVNAAYGTSGRLLLRVDPES